MEQAQWAKAPELDGTEENVISRQNPTHLATPAEADSIVACVLAGRVREIAGGV